jgi:hypothetical protein
MARRPHSMVVAGPSTPRHTTRSHLAHDVAEAIRLPLNAARVHALAATTMEGVRWNLPA